jgi:hypothetical protein
MLTLGNNREKRLRGTCEATDAELEYIRSIIQLKWQHPRLETILHQQPSEILDS